MYSKDFIILANNLYHKYKNYKKVESIIQVSKSTIQRWVSNLQYYLKDKPKQVRQRKLTPSVFYSIYELLEKNKQIQLKEIQEYIITNFNQMFSLTSILKYIKEFNYSRKLVSKHYYNKSIDDIKDKELIFKDEVRKIDINNIISIDETYFYFNDTLNYGWSRIGEKCIIERNKKQHKLSLIMAISNKKIINYKIISKPINKEIYLDFLKSINLNNNYLIADNVSFHKNKEIINYIEKNKSNMIFIPPYSPQYNPIEFVFSEIKRKIRKNHFINVEQLETYLNNKIIVSSRNLFNYFNYSLNKLI